MNEQEFLTRCRDDPIFFCEEVLGYKPYNYQREMLETTSLRIVACWGRQTGKTTTIAAKVIHYAFTHSNATILIVSKGLRQSMLMYGIISKQINDNPLLGGSITRVTYTQLWLSNGSTIIALPCGVNGANLRGHTADMVIMDEAAFMNDTVITQVIFPMIATKKHGIAIMLSTPWGRDSAFFRAFVDPRYWKQRVKSSESPSITTEFLDEQHHLIGDLRYRIEYEAEFIEDATCLFTQDMIARCIQKWQPTDKLLTEREINGYTTKIDGTYVLGGDLGKRMDYSVVVLLKREHIEVLNEVTGKPEKIWTWRLVYIKAFPLKTPLNIVMNHIEWLNEHFTIKSGCIDQTGIGDAPVEELSLRIRAIEGVPMYAAQTKHAVAQYGYLKVERNEVTLPDLSRDRDDTGGDLITQMAEQSFAYSNMKIKIETEEKGILVYRHPDGRHDDKLWALLMGLYATRNLTTR